MEENSYKPFGLISISFTDKPDTFVQGYFPCGSSSIAYKLTEYVRVPNEIRGFSHISLSYRFHPPGSYSPVFSLFLDDNEKGVFDTGDRYCTDPSEMPIVRLDEERS